MKVAVLGKMKFLQILLLRINCDYIKKKLKDINYMSSFLSFLFTARLKQPAKKNVLQ